MDYLYLYILILLKTILFMTNIYNLIALHHKRQRFDERIFCKNTLEIKKKKIHCNLKGCLEFIDNKVNIKTHIYKVVGRKKCWY